MTFDNAKKAIFSLGLNTQNAIELDNPIIQTKNQPFFINLYSSDAVNFILSKLNTSDSSSNSNLDASSLTLATNMLSPNTSRREL